jgi:uncharacterized protein YndB with AHSA1/START domain
MSTESTTPTGRLFVEMAIPASREKVFEAWTNPKDISIWMRPKGITAAEAELDVRVGGKLRVVTKGAAGASEYTGEYRVIEPPSKLAFTWTSKDTDRQPTLITIELKEDELEPGCQLTLAHAGFTSPAAMQRYGEGWTLMLEKLGVLEKTKRKRRRKMAKGSRSK